MGRLQAESSHDHLQVSEDHSLGLEPVTIPVYNLQNDFFFLNLDVAGFFFVYMLLEFLERVLEILFNVKLKILQISILILGRYIRV